MSDTGEGFAKRECNRIGFGVPRDDLGVEDSSACPAIQAASFKLSQIGKSCQPLGNRDVLYHSRQVDSAVVGRAYPAVLGQTAVM